LCISVDENLDKKIRVAKNKVELQKKEVHHIQREIETFKADNKIHEKEKKDTAAGKLDKMQSALEKNQEALAGCEEELNGLVRQRKSSEMSSIVQVTGIVFPGTRVKGVNASITTEQKFSHLYFKEVKKTNDQGTGAWKMQLFELANQRAFLPQAPGCR